jgi:hypothetical protein
MQTEILDDYERGTWTPTAWKNYNDTQYTLTSATGSYVKVGDQVTIWWNIDFDMDPGSGENVVLQDLPFPINNSGRVTNSFQAEHGTFYGLNGFAGGYQVSRANGTANGPYFIALQYRSGANLDSPAGDFVMAGFDIYGTLTYTTDL